MQQLEQLVLDAQRLAGGEPNAIDRNATDDEVEVARVLQICNACRYCEGFCAVFPAMTRRLDFPKADLHYLANLCHSCGACLHACQYAAPHEFAVNVPQAMARVRRQTYADYAWPRGLSALYARNGPTLALALAIGLAVFLILAVALSGSLWRAPAADGFFAVFPHNLMVSIFGPVFAFALLALGLGVSRFWRDVSSGEANREAALEASINALTLKYLDGGHGQGCAERDDASTLARRRFHHLTFYGFALCFAATSVATLYHYALGWSAPYGWASLPKLLGISGGIALVTGTLGLAWLHLRRHAQHSEPTQQAMNLGFIALLCLTGASGLALALARATPAVPLLLCTHLGAVMALFLTMPNSKFAHGIYRAASLLKWSIERRQPNRLALGGD